MGVLLPSDILLLPTFRRFGRGVFTSPPYSLKWGRSDVLHMLKCRAQRSCWQINYKIMLPLPLLPPLPFSATEFLTPLALPTFASSDCAQFAVCLSSTVDERVGVGVVSVGVAVGYKVFSSCGFAYSCNNFFRCG